MTDHPHHDAYKTAKESFVSQQTGGSVWTINSVSLTALTTYALWAALRNRHLRFVSAEQATLGHAHSRAHQFPAAKALTDWQLEFFILILPLVLANTLLAHRVLVLNIFLGGAVALVLLRFPGPDKSDSARSRSKEKAPEKHKRHWSSKSSDEEEDGDDGYDGGVPEPFNGVQFRVSVDSAGEAAHAAAAPHMPYSPPPSSSGFATPDLLALDPRRGHAHGSSGSSPSPLIRALNGAFAAQPSGSGEGMAETLADRFSANSDLAAGRRGSASSMRSLSRSGSPLPSIPDDVGHSSPVGVTAPPLPPSCAQAPQSSSAATFVRVQPFLSVYRGHMMLMTVICILAVDFPVFPREFAKCETWGTSLMDLGVGSFVFSLGLVSALPYLRSPRHRFRSMRSQLIRDARRSLPLIALGMVRVVMVKGVEYPEHVSEYGVHWNFFITLGLLPIAGTLCRPLSRFARFSTIGLSVGGAYQLALWTTGLQDWAIGDGPRVGLLTQNKEGITSFPGYLSIFLLGLDLGHYVLPQDPYLAYRRPSRSRRQAKTGKLAMVLASFSVLWWAAYGIFTAFGAGTSRRLSNLPYALWVTAFNTTFLLCYVLIYMLLLQPSRDAEDVQGGQRQGQASGQSKAHDDLIPSILEMINTHAFSMFLVANVLTGIINLSMQTLFVRDSIALIIVVFYCAACIAFATHVMPRLGWRLRL